MPLFLERDPSAFALGGKRFNRAIWLMDNHKPAYFGKDLEAMSFAQNYHQWIIEEFKPYLGDRVAEVGAGTGNFTELLLENVGHITAFEPSENMYPTLSERFTSNKKIESVNSIFEAETAKSVGGFDSVIYVNVLEHIEGDRQELSIVRESLREGGRVLIFVPALSFLYSNFDKKLGHYRRYHKNDLISLVKDARFKVEEAKYFDIAGIIPWYIAFVLLKKTLTGGNVSLYDKTIVPIMKRVEKRIVPPIGKNLLLVARKLS